MSTLTRDHVKDAMKRHAARFGRPAAMRIMKCVGGVTSLSELTTDRFEWLIRALDAEVPPSLGGPRGMPYGIRCFDYLIRIDGEKRSRSAMIPLASEVHPALRGLYWLEVETFAKVLERARERMVTLDGIGIVNSDYILIGAADLMVGDGPHELAFLSCFIKEVHDAAICFALPDSESNDNWGELPCSQFAPA